MTFIFINPWVFAIFKSNSGNQSGFTERIIGEAARIWLADDQVIEEAHLHDGGGIDDAIGDLGVGAAG